MSEQQMHYLVFAGINGAGKSTLFQTGLWLREEFSYDMKRVNSDEILRLNKGDSNNRSDQLKAMRAAVLMISEYFTHGQSFNQETTLSGYKSVRDIQKAVSLGYKVIMYYVGVNNPEIASARIKHRASIGGHYIEPEIVERRSVNSLMNLKAVLKFCDEAYLFDNTFDLVLVRSYRKGQLEFNRTNSYATWLSGLH